MNLRRNFRLAGNRQRLILRPCSCAISWIHICLVRCDPTVTECSLWLQSCAQTVAFLLRNPIFVGKGNRAYALALGRNERLPSVRLIIEPGWAKSHAVRCATAFWTGMLLPVPTSSISRRKLALSQAAEQ